MGHSVKSEYHIWVILQSCVPKVRVSYMGHSPELCTQSVTSVTKIGLSDVACLNAKKNG